MLAWGKKVFQEVVPCVFLCEGSVEILSLCEISRSGDKAAMIWCIVASVDFSAEELVCPKTSVESDCGICGEMFEL